MGCTVDAHTVRKGRKGTGQLERERSVGGERDLVRRGSGTEGGFVVERSAAKYRHSAGPVNVQVVRARISIS